MLIAVRNLSTLYGTYPMTMRNLFTLCGTHSSTMRNLITVYGKIWGTFLPYLARLSRNVGFPKDFNDFQTFFVDFARKNKGKSSIFRNSSDFFFFFGQDSPGGWGQPPASLQTVHSQPSTGTPGSINLYIDIKVMNHTNNESGSFMLAAWRLQPEALSLKLAAWSLSLKLEDCLVLCWWIRLLLNLIMSWRLEACSLKVAASSLKLEWSLSSININIHGFGYYWY